MFIPKGFPVYFAHIQRFTKKTAGAFWPNMPSSVTNNNWRVLQRFDVDVDVDWLHGQSEIRRGRLNVLSDAKLLVLER